MIILLFISGCQTCLSFQGTTFKIPADSGITVAGTGDDGPIEERLVQRKDPKGIYRACEIDQMLFPLSRQEKEIMIMVMTQ